MKRVIVAVSAVLLTTSLSADVNQNTGCGLGSMIFDNQDSVAKQILAATSNGSYGNNTFGISSGTSNCNKPAKIVSNEKLEKFVAQNMDELAIDIAAGEGENLDTLSSLMSIKDKAQFAKILKANFSKIYTSSDITSAEFIDSIVTIAG